MTNQELHDLIEKSEPPYTIATRGGRSYLITDRTQVWAPKAEPNMICVTPPRRGIFVLRTTEIESVQLEHDTTDPSYGGSVRHWTENR